LGGVQARLFESSSVKKGGESSEAKQLLYSSSFFLPDFNRRKISSPNSFFLQDFNRRKISSTNSFFLQDFNRSPNQPHSMGVK
jgi:hypothetical protein